MRVPDLGLGVKGVKEGIVLRLSVANGKLQGATYHQEDSGIKSFLTKDILWWSKKDLIKINNNKKKNVSASLKC